MAQLQSAVIGAGFVGRAHVEALRRLGVPVAGVLGSSIERSEASRYALRLPRAYGSLEELAADSNVNVVHICTPNYLAFRAGFDSAAGGEACDVREAGGDESAGERGAD